MHVSRRGRGVGLRSGGFERGKRVGGVGFWVWGWGMGCW